MLPARKYWARFLLHLALGFVAGMLVGAVVQSATDVAGWALVGATAGTVLGAFTFMLRADT